MRAVFEHTIPASAMLPKSHAVCLSIRYLAVLSYLSPSWTWRLQPGNQVGIVRTRCTSPKTCMNIRYEMGTIHNNESLNARWHMWKAWLSREPGRSTLEPGKIGQGGRTLICRGPPRCPVRVCSGKLPTLT